MISVNEAIELIIANVKPGRCEARALNESLGFSLAEDILADRDYPPFYRATMDGFALASADFNPDVAKHYPIAAEILAGDLFTDVISPGSCARIMTGASVPHGLDLVIPVEDSRESHNVVSFTVNTVKPYQNIAQKGEDCLKGQTVIHKGTVIDFSAIATLSSFGYVQVQCFAAPSVAILSTGSEIVNSSETPLDYQIRDSNSVVIQSFLDNLNIPVQTCVLVKDDYDVLKSSIEAALQHDILILSGGVSMGIADFVPKILKELGVQQIFHKVNIKPGKPLWFGTHDMGVVFGLPGNPVSCQVGFKVFIEPYIRKFMNLVAVRKFSFPIAETLVNKKGKDLYLPCRLSSEQKLIPCKNNGSGDISATLRSDGIALHPHGSVILDAGTNVRFMFWREP